MEQEPVYYQLPPGHDHQLRRMVRFLVLFFAGLILLAAAIVWNAQWLATKLPFSAEKRFADGMERTISGWFDTPRSAQRDLIESYLQDLADDMTARMEVPEDFQIKVHLMASKELNAFATLGGHLFIFSGLVKDVPDENTLAMVMGHEIAHIKHRDPLAGLGRGVALQIILGFVTGNSSSSADIAIYGGQAGLTYFSREQEQAADTAAIHALQSRYGHVAGSDTLFRIVAGRQQAEERLDIPEWLSTHPDLKARIDRLTDYARSQGWGRQAPQPVPEAVRQALEELKASSRRRPGEQA